MQTLRSLQLHLLDKPGLLPESRMEEIKQRFSTVLVHELPAGLPPDRGVDCLQIGGWAIPFL